MRHFLYTGLLFAGLSTSAAAQEHDYAWSMDFDKAVQVAKTEGKDLLVDFLGSDW